jgi:hypothetical protein
MYPPGLVLFGLHVPLRKSFAPMPKFFIKIIKFYHFLLTVLASEVVFKPIWQNIKIFIKKS